MESTPMGLEAPRFLLEKIGPRDRCFSEKLGLEAGVSLRNWSPDQSNRFCDPVGLPMSAYGGGYNRNGYGLGNLVPNSSVSMSNGILATAFRLWKWQAGLLLPHGLWKWLCDYHVDLGNGNGGTMCGKWQLVPYEWDVIEGKAREKAIKTLLSLEITHP
ncbi:hypothetical protein K2173_017982 [Erythroxylum novogranatense]|uniref:Uncharacterized protein n=1 Tax=Erythroxylum novogranatense TaxID=1862640 RepID=A0AAV8TVI5_9ROSI|nr:hypothetical protein K2173_017982 [Erythroxylum novogranatense]